MDTRELEEYRALRATIRERGTARVWVFLAGVGLWAGLTVATAALAPVPVAALLPLLALAATFEAVLGLHVGVERIGRYLQVFLEDDGGWEHTAMAFGRASPGTDPLFALVFGAATVLNFVPVLAAEPVAVEVVFVGAAHLAFIARLIVARRTAAGQRARDLDRFQRIKAGS